MDNLQDLLAKRMPQEPPEIGIVKAFVQARFAEPVNVSVNERAIVVTVGSASLAGALRSCTPEILRQCQTDKRLVLRIGRVV